MTLIKSVLVKRPAKDEFRESHRGADTISTIAVSCIRSQPRRKAGSGHEWRRTILYQDVEALFDEEVVVEDDQSEGQREHIVAGSDFEEFANRSLMDADEAVSDHESSAGMQVRCCADEREKAHQTLHLLPIEGADRPLGHGVTVWFRAKIGRRRDKGKLVASMFRERG